METFKNFTLNTFDLNSLRLRLILAITFFIALITAILQYYSLGQFEEASTLNLEHEGLLLSDTLEATTLHELAQNNIHTIQEHINRLVSNREVNDIEINILSISPNGSEIVASNVSDNIEAADEEEHLELLNALNSGQANIFFEVETNDNDPDDIDLHELEIEEGENHPDNYFQDNSRYMSITTPLILDGVKLGGINVKLSLHPLDIKLTQIRKMLLMSILAATALVLFGLGLLLNRKIFLPINQLQKDMDSVANGNLDLQLTASRRVDEIGQLAQAFNSMTRQLQRTQSQLHQYLNPMAIKEAYRRARHEQPNPEAEEKEISVLFVDIVSFTTTTERLGPTSTVAYLNNFYDRISESIRDANGYIDKFVADELICVFEGQSHAEDAVNTARKILDNLKGCKDCKVRIGINSGSCIIADIGSRMMGRMDRTIIGDTVNVAQRLMSVAEPDSAVFSLTTWQSIENREDITSLAPQKLKGKAFPVKAFALGYNINPLPIDMAKGMQEIALAS